MLFQKMCEIDGLQHIAQKVSDWGAYNTTHSIIILSLIVLNAVQEQKTENPNSLWCFLVGSPWNSLCLLWAGMLGL